MCCRSAFTKPIFSRYEMKTAIPPNGVTARCVSRRIKRSSDNSASISRGTGLSVAFGLILLLSQILAGKPTPNFGFPVYEPGRLRVQPHAHLRTRGAVSPGVRGGEPSILCEAGVQKRRRIHCGTGPEICGRGHRAICVQRKLFVRPDVASN